MINDLIIDAGMHKGEDTEFYLKKGFRVVGIEANPELCAIAEKKLRRFISNGKLTIINAAITEKAEPTLFYTSEHATVWGTTRESWVKRNNKMGVDFREIVVEGVRFEQILNTYGVPYYLKVDIEGCDHLCLEGLLGESSTPKHISIESVKTSWQDLLREFELFRSLGFTQFKVVNQKNVPNQICPRPALEGTYVNHSFSKGDSGLFGEESPGQWLPESRALLSYKLIFFKYWLYGNNGVFPNLHIKTRQWPKLSKFVHPGWYDTHAKR